MWEVWLNDWVFIYELSDCGLESSCSYLNFRFCGCFEEGVPSHSANYRVWFHSETRTWREKNMQSNALYGWVLTTRLNDLGSFGKLLSVGLWTKWLWVRVQLQSLKFQNLHLLWSRGSLIFRTLSSVDSHWNSYVTWQKIQSNAQYRQVLTTQLNHIASFSKWSSVRLWTKWLWVRV